MRQLLIVGLSIAALFLVSCTAEMEPAPKQQVESLLSKGEYIPDIGTFLQIGACSPAGYTWDGQSVFFRSSMSGSSQIYRITDEAWPYQLTTFDDGIDFFSLSWDGTMAIVGASTGGSEQSQLFLMDAETGRVLQLTSVEDVQYGSVTWAPDSKSIFFRSNEENKKDFFVYKLNIATAEYGKIFGDAEEGVSGYNAIADVSSDGNYMIIYNFTSNVNDDLYLLDLNTLKYQKLTEDEGDVIYDSPTLMPDGKTIWLTCNGNDDGITRIAKMTVGSPKVEFVDDGWVDQKWEVDGLSFSRDYKHMAAVTNEDGYGKLHLREVETGRHLPSPPLEGMQGMARFNRQGGCIMSFSSATFAPEVWLWEPNSGTLKQLTFSIYAGIDRTIFREPTLVRYTSFDGLEIPAFLYLPPNYKQGEKIPFIIHAHGGPEGQTRPRFVRNIQYLMLNGYGILAPNPRGSSGYTREYLNLDNYKNRKHSLMDYKAGVEWLIDKGYTQEGMLGIRGGSYGGYVVLGMITEYPELFSAACDIVGIANFKSFLENTRSYRRALRESEYGPLSDPDFLKEISPIHKAHLIKTPLLVIHGENDPRVPVDEARQIIRAVRQNGGVIDSLIFPDEGHGASKRVNIIAEYRKQVQFFNEHLKSKSISATPGKG